MATAAISRGMDRERWEQLSADEQVLLVRSRDPEAMAYLFKEWYMTLTKYAFREIHNWDDAEDIAQQVFVRINNGAPSLRGPSFRNWMFQIFYNLLKDYQKNIRRNHLSLLDDDEAVDDVCLPVEPTAIAKSECNELRHAVAMAVSRLSVRQREALELSFLGLEYDEIAMTLNTTVSATKMRLSRARSTVRQILVSMGLLESSGSQ